MAVQKDLSGLPIITIEIGGVSKTVRHDIENGVVYLLDENGQYTGKFAKMPVPPTAAEATAPNAPSESEETVEESNNERQPPVPDAPDPIPSKRKWSPLLLPVLILCLIIFVFPLFFKGEPQIPTETQDETTPPEMVTVLSAPEDILPGQPLSPILWDATQITEEEYRMLATLTSVYTDRRALADYVAARFIPAGKYLSAEDVAGQYAVCNPWAQDSGCTFPITVDEKNLRDFLWGTVGDVKISAESPSATVETQHNGVGMNATIVNTYTVQDVVVIDLLDIQGKSLFAQYQALAQIPITELADYLTANGWPVPAAIVFSGDLSDFARSGVITDFAPTGVQRETSLQRDLYGQMQSVADAIRKEYPG